MQNNARQMSEFLPYRWHSFVSLTIWHINPPLLLVFCICNCCVCCTWIYVVCDSPSNVSLRSHGEVRQYLLKEGTCKCGLQCPLIVDKTFVFDARQKQSKHLLADDIHSASDRSNSLCNHRRKIIAVATFQQSTGFRFTKPETTSVHRLPLPVPQTTEATGKCQHSCFTDFVCECRCARFTLKFIL